MADNSVTATADDPDALPEQYDVSGEVDTLDALAASPLRVDPIRFHRDLTKNLTRRQVLELMTNASCGD